MSLWVLLSGVIVSFDRRGIERSGFVVIRSVLSSSRFDMTRSPRYRRREIFTGERASGQQVFGGFGMQRGNGYGRELGRTRQEPLS